MAMTQEQIELAITTMQKQLEVIMATISQFPLAYVSKLQWKQLDNQRGGKTFDLETAINNLASRIEIIEQHLNL